MDDLARDFVDSHDEQSAIGLLRSARCQGLYHIGVVLGEFLAEEFPNSLDIKDEYGIMMYYSGDPGRAYFIFQEILLQRCLDQEKAEHVLFNQHFCVDAIKDRHVGYDPSRVRFVSECKGRRASPLVTVTVTSCRRWDLFRRTIDSFTKCCKDVHLVHEWVCVDDNSSEADRREMERLYPFFRFYFKGRGEKGHPQSMNMIRRLVKTPYMFHLEDDWQFIERRDYISECLDVLGQDPRIGQCLLNKNYGEVPSDRDIKGGAFRTTASGLRYYIHEFVCTKEDEKAFREKHGQGKTCNYWPHYSLRPGLVRTRVLNELGPYSETGPNFEMDYGVRYTDHGYVSAFLEGIYCIHIGRLTTERRPGKCNAYDLNDEAQFSEKRPRGSDFPFRLKAFVINLDSRPDRWERFIGRPGLGSIAYERFPAVDGSRLRPTPQLLRIFDGNDYNMRRGMVGCAMSHLKLYTQLLTDDEADAYLLMEDDIEFVPGFEEKLLYCASELHKTEWDIFYLGHHLWEQYIDDKVYSKTLWPRLERLGRAESLQRSMGGTAAYMISKRGAEGLLDYIDRTGMTNAIDTMQQKSADTLNVYYVYPHLVYSECFRGGDGCDTDVQFNYDSLAVPLDQRLSMELEHHAGAVELKDPEAVVSAVERGTPIPFYYRSGEREEIRKLAGQCTRPCYTLDDRILFVCANGSGYPHRFKKNGHWSVEDAVCEGDP